MYFLYAGSPTSVTRNITEKELLMNYNLPTAFCFKQKVPLIMLSRPLMSRVFRYSTCH